MGFSGSMQNQNDLYDDIEIQFLPINLNLDYSNLVIQNLDQNLNMQPELLYFLNQQQISGNQKLVNNYDIFGLGNIYFIGMSVLQLLNGGQNILNKQQRTKEFDTDPYQKDVKGPNDLVILQKVNLICDKENSIISRCLYQGLLESLQYSCLKRQNLQDLINLIDPELAILQQEVGELRLQAQDQQRIISNLENKLDMEKINQKKQSQSENISQQVVEYVVQVSLLYEELLQEIQQVFDKGSHNQDSAQYQVKEVKQVVKVHTENIQQLNQQQNLITQAEFKEVGNNIRMQNPRRFTQYKNITMKQGSGRQTEFDDKYFKNLDKFIEPKKLEQKKIKIQHFKSGLKHFQKVEKDTQYDSQLYSHFSSILDPKCCINTIVQITDRIIASGGSDSQIKLWDWKTCRKEEPSPLLGHGNPINALCCLESHQDGDHFNCVLASGSQGDSGVSIKIWEVSTEQYTIRDTLKSHDASITDIKLIDRKGRLFASSSIDTKIVIWSCDKHWDYGKELRVLEGHALSVLCLCQITQNNLPDTQNDFKNNYDLSSNNSIKQQLKISDFNQNEENKNNEENYSYNLIASGSDDCTIRIWDWEKYTCPMTLVGHKAWVQCLVYMHDSNILASGSGDQTVMLWQLQTGSLVKTIRTHTGSVSTLAYNHKQFMLSSAASDLQIVNFNMKSMQVVDKFKGHKDKVLAFVNLKNQKFSVSGSVDSVIRVWKVKDVVNNPSQVNISGESQQLQINVQNNQNNLFHKNSIVNQDKWFNNNSDNLQDVNEIDLGMKNNDNKKNKIRKKQFSPFQQNQIQLDNVNNNQNNRKQTIFQQYQRKNSLTDL